VQLYVHDPVSSVPRPAQELKRFAKGAPAPDETRTVTFALGAGDLALFDAKKESRVTEPGSVEISIGGSSRGGRLTTTLTVQ
jgi:beta-glucosidase